MRLTWQITYILISKSSLGFSDGRKECGVSIHDRLLGWAAVSLMYLAAHAVIRMRATEQLANHARG